MSQPSRRRLHNEMNGETGHVGDDQVSQWVNILPKFTTQFVFEFINWVKVHFPYSFMIISFTI